VEIALIADYPNPWRNRTEEYAAVAESRWAPSSDTFRTIASCPNEILRKQAGKMTLPDLIEVRKVATLREMTEAICRLPDGAERAKGSVKRVNLFAHGKPGLIGLAGQIVPSAKTADVILEPKNEPRRPDIFYSHVDFGANSKIDELAIQWLNWCGKGHALRERIRNVFCQGAELWLLVCNGSGGMSGIGPGIATNLSKMIATTFQVMVRSYENSVWYWPTYALDPKAGCQIGSINRTSDGVGKPVEERVCKRNGRKDEPDLVVFETRGHLGYHTTKEKIMDPETNKPLGEHMKNAARHAAGPKADPRKELENCPDKD